MIHYELKCPADHVFEGWFRDSAAFDEQAAAHAVACPICNDTAIERAPMAPRVAKHAPAETALPKDVQLRQMLQQMRRHIESNFESVGDAFAEEARKIHYGDADPRGIYGQTTPEEAEALKDEGIEFGAIPWIAPTDS